MNLEKTKYLCIGDQLSELGIGTESIQPCEEYLGVEFDTSGTDDNEIRSRVIEARKVIGCLNGILWSKNITRSRKFNIYNTMIKSQLTYGSETWRLTERNKRRIEAPEMDALRRSARISRMRRIRNQEVRNQLEVEGTIMDDIE
ncbi:uncharacterized protein LOC123674005 [Harmonia axyridis]|uniref:uncharacterized protein LOC123674005 n=1 Tax=Harmonia axyridis TaxID=115357 RepID=UPI001E2787BC|nr:uncharacterized protein LOC123674005 [Harmonia axyridis]